MPNMRLGTSLHPHPREANIAGTIIPCPFLGDEIIAGSDGEVFLYGLRQLKSDYFGPLIRVRSGILTEKDFYANPITKQLDPQEVEDWVKANAPLFGNNYGRVVKWYDQGPNARHVTQIIWSNQPYITFSDGTVCRNPHSGRLEIWNIKPEFAVKGSDGGALCCVLQADAIRSAGKKGTIFAVYRPVAFNQGIDRWWTLDWCNDFRLGFQGNATDQGFCIDAANAEHVMVQETRPGAIAGGTTSNIWYDAGLSAVLAWAEDGTLGNCGIYLNGMLGSDTLVYNDNNNWYTGSGIEIGGTYKGCFQEVIFANTHPSSFTGGITELVNLHNAQKDCFGLPTDFVYSDEVSLQFDGVNDYVTIPEKDYYANNADEDKWHSIIFKRSRTGVVEYLWSKMNASGGEALYFDTDDTLHYIWTDGTDVSHYKTSTVFNDTDWHMVSVQLDDPRYVSMYVDNSTTNDAVQISQADFGAIANVAADELLLIGKRYDGSYFQGLINRMWFFNARPGSDDHCEIWADGRPSCVRACEGASSLVYQWRFGNQDNRGIQRGLLWDLHEEHMHGTLVHLSEADLVADVPGAP